MGGGGNADEDAEQERESGGFRSGGKESGDGSGNAFVDVRAPDLEGSGGHVEAKADQNHRKAELQVATVDVRVAHGRDHGRVGGAVNEGDAVKEECRGEGAEEEILERRFAGFMRFAAIAGEDVAGDGTHFKADECGEEFLRRGKDAHTGGGEEKQGEKFRRIEIAALEIGSRAKHHEKGDKADKQVEEEAEGIGTNQAGEAGTVIPGGDDGKRGAADGADKREERKEVAVLEERLKQHDEHAEAAPNKLGHDENEISGGGHAGVHLAGAGPFRRSVFRSLR